METPNLSFWLGLLVVFILQLTLIRMALRESWKAKSEESAKDLEVRCQDDIKLLASHGHSPDMNQYLSEAERLFEFGGDRMRNCASSALAVGLFSTLAFLILNWWTYQHSQGSPQIKTLIGETILSLVGSFLGVIAHLFIVLWVLHKSEDQFSTWLRGFQARLVKYGGQPENRPEPALVSLLRTELAAIRVSLTSEFASALATAVTGFPDVVTNLSATVHELSGAVAAQGATIGAAVNTLKKNSESATTTTQLLAPAVLELASSIKVLDGLPARLNDVLDKSRNQWLTEITAAQDDRLKVLIEVTTRVEQAAELRDQRRETAVRSLQVAVEESRMATSSMATDLADKINESAGQIGLAFGNEARTTNLELAEKFTAEGERLLRRAADHEQAMRNQIGSIVDELFTMVGNGFREGILDEVRKVAGGLDMGAKSLGDSAQLFDWANQEWSTQHNSTLSDWARTSSSILDATTELLSASGQVKQASVELGASIGQWSLLAQTCERLLGRVGTFQLHQDRLLDRQADALKECLRLISNPDSSTN